jgi:type I restriction-modification system DNA methylase subunit
MADPQAGEARGAFLSIFRKLAPYKHRYEVFKDFVTMAAISLHNALYKDQKLEDEYLAIINGYKPDDQQAFPKLMGCLVEALEPEPRDILGPLYMDLEIANKDAGQFFTLPEVSDLMASLTFADQLDQLEHQPFITASEPACGAGGMLLALVKTMIAKGHNPAERIWMQAIDVDRMAALMCYIQLTLWNVPAEVIVGNTLSLEVREVWYTPAHHLGLWKYRLKRQEEGIEFAATTQPSPPKHKPKPQEVFQPDTPAIKPTQLGFDV